MKTTIKLATENIGQSYFPYVRSIDKTDLQQDIVNYRYLQMVFGNHKTKLELMKGIDKANKMLNDSLSTDIFGRMVKMLDLFAQPKNASKEELTREVNAMVADISFRITHLQGQDFEEVYENQEHNYSVRVICEGDDNYELSPVLRNMAIELDSDFIASLVSIYEEYTTRFEVM